MGYVYGYVHDSYASEDIVAEAFLSVLARVRKGAGPTHETFLSHMRVCIRNEAIKRGKASAREIPVEAIEDAVGHRHLDQETELSEAIDEDAALRAFATLPPHAQRLGCDAGRCLLSALGWGQSRAPHGESEPLCCSEGIVHVGVLSESQWATLAKGSK